MPKMKATRRLPYAGRTREIGEVFEASEKDAGILSKIGASYVTADVVADIDTKVMTTPETRSTRRGGRPPGVTTKAL